MKVALNLIKLFFVFLLFSPLAYAANPIVEFETNQGNFKIELYPEKAPKTVSNFLYYVDNGFYKETIFHRVISNFMIQGGGFNDKMVQKPTKAAIKNEADNGLKNAKYTIAMARTNDPHSATAQFFINVADNEFLNFSSPTDRGWGYAVFGKVSAGMDVVDNIRKVKTGNNGFHQNVPLEPVTILKAELSTK